MTTTARPLIAVADVEASSSWYQRVLGAASGHGGREYETLVIDDVVLLQLHQCSTEHHHGPLADHAVPLGNGVAVWFQTGALDAAVNRIRELGATVVTDLHANPNAGQREIWLHDPDGYLVVLSGP